MPGNSAAVAGLGNLLLTDDGIGVWLIRALQEFDLPDSLTLHEIGTSVFALHSLAAEHSSLLLVDAMHGGRDPGTVYRLSAEEVRLLYRRQGEKSLSRFHSLHDFQILDLMALPGNAGPNWQVFGVEPAEIGFGIGLSPFLAEKLPAIVPGLLGAAEEMAARAARI